MSRVKVATWIELADRQPTGALVGNVDLVVVRYDDAVSVLYGRCLHRGAMLADGHVDGPNLICGLHGWDYRYDTGVSEYNNAERLHRFQSWVEHDACGWTRTRSSSGRRPIPNRIAGTRIKARSKILTARRRSRTSA